MYMPLFQKNIRKTYASMSHLNSVVHKVFVAPVGVVTFERKYISKFLIPRWDRVDNKIGHVKVHISSSGTIEDSGVGLLQVDFANKIVGGGVLGFGCVQEEIRYIICPELIISRLFTEELGPNEALKVTGAECYSKYAGYGDTFRWSGNCFDEIPYDSYGRKRTSIVAIDATHFNNYSDQFYPSLMLRELNKAFVGFDSKIKGELQPVATGNWGCGAFKGDINLKFVIQLMACCAAKRNMAYYTFGDPHSMKRIFNMYSFLSNNDVTISQLWRYLCRFAQANLTGDNLCSYIQQALLDNSKLSNVSVFEINKHEDSCNMPSTSSLDDTYRYNLKKPEVCSKSKLNMSKSNAKLSTDEGIALDIVSSEAAEENNLSENCYQVSHESDLRNVQEESNHNDVISLINIIDGNINKKNNVENSEHKCVSLLSVNELCKKSINDNIHKNDTLNVHSISMDAEDITEQDIHVHKIYMKKKITDYFLKIDKG